mmetsp:Transcript_28051/g.52233  ORF Transcript_28051/g.52233 Transcript_28051/m.52233 type:complete len:83 (+) Transcript_28051:66-314(+)
MDKKTLSRAAKVETLLKKVEAWVLPLGRVTTTKRAGTDTTVGDNSPFGRFSAFMMEKEFVEEVTKETGRKSVRQESATFAFR